MTFFIQIQNQPKIYFTKEISIAEILKEKDKKLYDKVIAIELNNSICEINHKIKNNSFVKLIFNNEYLGLKILNYSCAFILSQAVKKIYPNIKLGNYYFDENKFFYDFDSIQTFKKEDLEKIEQEMQQFLNLKSVVKTYLLSKNEAIKIFYQKKENYKVKILQNLSVDKQFKIISNNKNNFYDISFEDIPYNFTKIKFFKLNKISGAYWNNDKTKKMLNRIHGICVADINIFEKIINNKVENNKLDHRKIGEHLDLFHFQHEFPKDVFWHPKGMLIFLELEKYIRKSNFKYNYKEIKTPMISNIELWKKSKHIEKYTDNMFMLTNESNLYAIKPMNCPNCMEVYKNKIYSYKDLPIRLSELGLVHRNESSGSLHGLFRMRSFTQDDAHIFCTKNQIIKEIENILQQCINTYKDFGFDKYTIKLALRPENRLGNDEDWDEAEKLLAEALNNNNFKFVYCKNEGAFYGPKIEFHLKDLIGRNWQCGTIQLDFITAKNLKVEYINKENEKKNPIILHKAVLGSFERFIGILIEHYKGKLPFWLSPIQVVLIGISINNENYLQKIYNNLIKLGIRVKIDLRNETIGFRIRDMIMQKIPIIGIIGNKEQINNNISIRNLQDNKVEIMDLENFYDTLLNYIKIKCRSSNY